MSQDIVNSNQGLSYTNQDFSSIYPEVLSLIKQLTYKWDPSISDESDPGVVLVKLSALLADKCNYNIDKSILEAFPLSVTQDANARQLYSQLGYYMDWYESATTPVSINWTSTKVLDTNDTVVSYTIPKFTIITDSESQHSYCLIGVEGDDGVVVSDILLPTDGTVTLAVAMEGTPARYTYQGENIITAQMVDTITHRLYFTTSLVSQNGVFIKNTNQQNYASWKRVNNIYEQDYNDLRYMFGYDSQSKLCYIEFPDNYAELIGSGIEITYLIIPENYSNLPANQLTQFLSNVTITSENTEKSITLNTTNTKIVNYAAASGHKDKESIDEAYINYKKTVGTFKTLVTLRDYLNYIRDVDHNICSNAFVCDRTNDIQSVYKIMSRQNDLDTILVKVEQIYDNTTTESTFNYKFKKSTDTSVVAGKTYYKITQNNTVEPVVNPSGSPLINNYYELSTVQPKAEDALSAFSLKLYLLRNAISLTSRDAYDETFNMIYNPTDIDTLLNDTAHLEHTYESILPMGVDTYKKSTDSRFMENKSYYLYDSVTDTYELITDLSAYSVVYEAVDISEQAMPIGKVVNPSELGWYEEVDGSKVLSSDTFARLGQKNSGTEETPILSRQFFIQATVTTSSSPVLEGWYQYDSSDTYFELTSDTSPVAGKMYYVDKNYFISHIQAPTEFPIYEIDVEALLPHTIFFKNTYPLILNISTYEAVNSEVQTIIMNNVITALYQGTNSSQVEFGENLTLEYLTKVVEGADDRIRNATFDTLSYTTKAVLYDGKKGEYTTVTLDDDMSTLNPTNYQDEDSIRRSRVKKDIVAKSILAGVTQLLIPDTEFIYHLSQKYISYVGDVTNITSEAVINIEDAGVTTYYDGEDSSGNDVSYITKTYTLKANETLTLYRPSLTTTKEFSTGVRYEYLINSTIEAGQSYELKRGEYIIFYSSITDDSGSITGYSAYACTKGMIISPGVRLVAQTSLSSLTGFARNRLISYFTVNPSVNYYELNTYNETYKTELRNNTTLSSNEITGTNSVQIQELNTYTYTIDNKWKFFWVLNNPTYSNDNNLKTYTLFRQFDSQSDSGLNTTINEYTLKSGEYLYCTDSDEKVLNVYGPGTTITRNCGVDETTVTYNPIHTSTYFQNYETLDLDDGNEFQVICNMDDDQINPYANGFYVVKNNPVPYSGTGTNPAELSLYRRNQYSYYELAEEDTFMPGATYYADDIFERTTDIRPVSGTVYYMPLMHKEQGWYNRYINTDTEPVTYNYSLEELSEPVFDLVDVTSNLQNINPQEEGLYEIVATSTGAKLIDKYQFNSQDSYNAHYRYTHTTDTTTLSRNILRDAGIAEYKIFDLSNISSYVDIDTSDFDNTLNPVVLNLMEPTYKSYYKLEGGEYVEVTNVDYLDNPYALNWYEKDEEGSYVHVGATESTPVILEVKNTTQPLIIKQIMDIAYSTACEGKGYFAKPNAATTVLTYVNGNEPYFKAQDVPNGVYSSPLTYMFNIYSKLSTDYEEGDSKLVAIEDSWTENYSYMLPGDWACPTFTQKGTWTSQPSEKDANTYFVKVSDSTITSGGQMLSAIYPAFTNDAAPSSISNADFYIQANMMSGYGIVPSAENPVKYYSKDSTFVLLGGTPTQRTQANLRLARLFPGNRNDVSAYGTIQLYYLPYIYRFRDFVTYTTSKYYSKKDYVTKMFGNIDAWTCTAIDNNSLVEDPIGTLTNMWRTLQYNTSLTVNESALWSFAEGDKVMFRAEESNQTFVEWPEFTNTETVLDLNQYSVSYERDGEIQELDNLNIQSYKWKGYSNLLLNTESTNGQPLESNQSITLYNNSSEEAIAVISGDPDYAVTFQLKYPVANKAGTFINVATTDTVGTTLPNIVYAFKSLPNGDYYSYTTDKYYTYLYFNNALDRETQVRSPRDMTLPLGVPAGNYLIPFTSKAETTLKVAISKVTETDDEDLDINMIPAALDEAEGGMKFYGVPTTYYLSSYVDSSVTEFTGNKYQFIKVSLDEYEEIKMAAYHTYSMQESPKSLRWYEYSDGEYHLSEDTNIGSALIERIPVLEIKAGDNPSQLHWYEYVNNVYIISEDTAVNFDKKYYRDKKFYLPLNRVDPSITFSIDPAYDKQITYILNDIFKYENNPLLGTSFDTLVEHMHRLDNEQDYNYVYVPYANDLISNPLEAKSFWTANHIYNPYTIAQLNFDDIDYKFISNK